MMILVERNLGEGIVDCDREFFPDVPFWKVRKNVLNREREETRREIKKGRKHIYNLLYVRTSLVVACYIP